MGSERTDDTGAVVEPPQPVVETGPVGRLIAGRYRLAGLIGAGAMGAVWLARDELLDVDVAVKEIRPPFAFTRPGDEAGDGSGADEDDSWAASTGAWASRALREARNAARLRANPHVVTVHDAVVDDGAPWIVMEAVAARSLQEAVAEDGPLPLADVARIGLAVLDALVAAQALGVVHRDVKPSNILLAHDGRVLLTDFGIAAADTDPTLTQPPDGGLPSGTPAYMAPERLQGGPTTLTADLFALGATLLFAADGAAPFQRDSLLASLQAVLFDDPAPSRDLGPLAPVIAGLLVKDPVPRLRADGAAALLVRAQRALDSRALAPASTLSWRTRGLGGPSSGQPTGPDAAESGTATGRTASLAAEATMVLSPGEARPGGDETPSAASGGHRGGQETPESAAAPVALGQLDPDALAGSDLLDGPGRPVRSLPRWLPMPFAVIAVVVVLALAGLGTWGAVAASAGRDRSPATGASATARVASTPGGAGGPLGARAGAVPGEMVGSWHGTVSQDPFTFDVTVRIRGGAIGATIGTAVSSAGCAADLVLRETGVSTVTVQEVLTQSNQRCIGAFRLLLTVNSNGTLGYFYDATLITTAGVATLTRITPSPTGGRA